MLVCVACRKDPNAPIHPYEPMPFSDTISDGVLPGLFSTSLSKQVCFSRGNLQYQASTDTWRFAKQQFDYVGTDNANVSPTYSGWIDLFGFGTSGYDGKYPYMTSTSFFDYAVGEIAGTNYDWGVYNAISNGGNQTGLWRTPTKDEWVYLFNKRMTSSGIRYAKANVNGKNGVILLPDDWDVSVFVLSNTNQPEADYTSNTIDASQWTEMEEAGAVFLPAAGGRDGISVVLNDSNGSYWSTSWEEDSGSTTFPYLLGFNSSGFFPDGLGSGDFGRSVRLVQDASSNQDVAGFKLDKDNLDFFYSSSSRSFKIINTSTTKPVSWSIAESQDWMTVSPNFGTLHPEEETIVMVDIDRTMIQNSFSLYGMYWVSSSITITSEEKTLVLPVVVTMVEAEIQTLPYFQKFDFEFGTYWVFGDVAPQSWTINNSTATMSGYTTGMSYENEDWLISSPVDLSGVSDAKMTMSYIARYFGNLSEELTIWASTNYVYGRTPHNADWTRVEADLVESANWTDFQIAEIALTDLVGQTITIAVKYVSTNDNAGTVEIQSITIEEGTPR